MHWSAEELLLLMYSVRREVDLAMREREREAQEASVVAGLRWGRLVRRGCKELGLKMGLSHPGIVIPLRR